MADGGSPALGELAGNTGFPSVLGANFSGRQQLFGLILENSSFYSSSVKKRFPNVEGAYCPMYYAFSSLA